MELRNSFVHSLWEILIIPNVLVFLTKEDETPDSLILEQKRKVHVISVIPVEISLSVQFLKMQEFYSLGNVALFHLSWFLTVWKE